LAAFFLFWVERLPAGPVIVLMFGLSFFDGSYSSIPFGVFFHLGLRTKKRGQRIRCENTLKACYQVLEESSFSSQSFSQTSLARRRRKSDAEIEREIDALDSSKVMQLVR
jgi:hypothetical protein